MQYGTSTRRFELRAIAFLVEDTSGRFRRKRGPNTKRLQKCNRRYGRSRSPAYLSRKAGEAMHSRQVPQWDKRGLLGRTSSDDSPFGYDGISQFKVTDVRPKRLDYHRLVDGSLWCNDKFCSATRVMVHERDIVPDEAGSRQRLSPENLTNT